MTRIVFTQTSQTAQLVCCGHADFSVQGRDIVCAGVSSLCFTLLRAVKSLEQQGKARTEDLAVRSGFFCLRIRFEQAAQTECETVYRTVFGGLCALQDAYPDHVSCVDHTKEAIGMENYELQLFSAAESDASAPTEAQAIQAQPSEEEPVVLQEQQDIGTEAEVQREESDPALSFLQSVRTHFRQYGKDRMQEWQAQEEDLRTFYPSFSFQEEYDGNETFAGLLQAGVGVREAYEVTHLPEILTAAMQYAARTAAAKTAASVLTGTQRPTENGVAERSAPMAAARRVDSLTQKDILRILDRVGKGDKVIF